MAGAHRRWGPRCLVTVSAEGSARLVPETKPPGQLRAGSGVWKELSRLLLLCPSRTGHQGPRNSTPTWRASTTDLQGDPLRKLPAPACPWGS